MCGEIADGDVDAGTDNSNTDAKHDDSGGL